MGMKVGGSSAGWSSYQTSSVSGWQQRQQGMKGLLSSLKAGDLAAAQQAFASLQSNNTSNGNSALTKIGDALQAGDLAGAQQAAQAMHTARGGHHHAHDATQASGSSTASSSAASTTAAGADTSTAFNSFIQNLEAALEQQGKTTTDANGQGSFFFRMPPPPADLANATTSAPTSAASTQAFLSGRDNTSVQSSNAQLEASLESLIQQMNGTPGVSASTIAAAATNTASTNSNLQTSFANLMGAMGGQSSSASVTDFLQTLDSRLKAMDAASSGVNQTA